MAVVIKHPALASVKEYITIQINPDEAKSLYFVLDWTDNDNLEDLRVQLSNLGYGED